MFADPEGAAHGCAAFFYEAGSRLEKSLRRWTPLREMCTGKAFSLVRFFDAYQRNELARSAGETLLTFAPAPGCSHIEAGAEVNGKVRSFRLRRLRFF
ncbi:hypothetical protein [Luteimonas notoginsengisoli]